MDVSKYAQSKAAGAVEMKRYGDSFQCVKKQFNPDTGVEILPTVSTFTEQQLLIQKDAAEKLLESVNVMLADLQALKQPK